MWKSRLMELSGPAALLAGLTWIVYAVGTNFIGESHAAYHVLNAPPNALLAVSTAGLYLYLRRSGRFGKLGSVAFYVCLFVFALEAVGGLAIIVSETMFGGAFVEVLDVVHPFVLLLLLGSVLFGVAILRAGVLPRGGAVTIVAIPLVSVGVLFSGLETDWLFSTLMALLGLGWAWLGYGLYARRGEELAPPQPRVQ